MVKDVSTDIKIVRIQSKLEEAKKNSPAVICFNDLHEIVPRMVCKIINDSIMSQIHIFLQMVNSNEHVTLIKTFVEMLKQLQQGKSYVVVLIGITHLLPQVNSEVLNNFYSTKNDKEISFDYPDISGYPLQNTSRP